MFAIVDYALYCQKVCQDICEQTGWKVFKIKQVSHVVSYIRKGTAKSRIKIFQEIHISEKSRKINW